MTYYDPQGRTLYTVDRFDHQTRDVYDAAGRTIETRSHAQATTSTTDPLRWSVTRTVYDAAGRAVYSTDPFLIEADGTDDPVTTTITGTRTTYDKAGRSTMTEGLEGLRIDITTDTQGRVISKRIDSGTVIWQTESHYNTKGQLEWSLDRYKNETRYVYDSLGRTIETRTQTAPDASGNAQWLVGRTVYDDDGRVSHSTDQFLLRGASGSESPVGTVTGTHTIYDEAGRVIQTEGREDLSITIQGATGGPFTSVLTSEGTVVWQTESEYNTIGQLVASIGRHDPAKGGPRTDYVYDDFGRQEVTLGPILPVADGDFDDFTLDGATLVRHRSETVYDDMGRTAYTTRNILDIVNLEGDTLSTDDSDRQVQLYEYDDEGRTIKTTQEGYVDGALKLSISADTRYDQFGRVVAESDPYHDYNVVTLKDMEVEWNDDVASFVDTLDSNALVPTKLSEYDDFGRLSAVVLSQVKHPDLGTMVNPRYDYTYDERGNLETIRDNVYQTTTAGVTQIYYDHDGAAGNFNEAFDTRVTEFTYDDRGRQKTRTLPIGVSTTGDATDFVESKNYDSLGRVTYEVSFEGVVTAYVYDDADGLDPGDAGRLVAKHYYDALSAYQNDLGDDGLLNSSYDTVDYAHDVVTYQHDARGREVSTLQQFDEDADRLIDRQRLTQNVYDDTYGRLITVKADIGNNGTFEQQIHYEYEAVTGLLQRTYTGLLDEGDAASDDDSAVTDTRYDYDDLGRLDTVTVYERFDTVLGTPEMTDYVYDLVGNLARTDLAGGVSSDYQYDALNRLDVLTHYAPNDSVLSSFNYEVRADGKRTAVDESVYNGSSTKTTRVDWVYDNIGRLVGEAYNADTAVDPDSLDFIARYQFDLVGNRRTKETDQAASDAAIAAFLSDNDSLSADETISYDYDDNDRLESELKDVAGWADDRLTVYGYDGTQQISKDVHATSADDGLTTSDPVVEETDYTFNLQGRMDSATVDLDNDGTIDRYSEFVYDDSGVRVAQLEQVDANDDGDLVDEGDKNLRTDYLVDKNNHTGYAQVLEEMNGATGELLKSYTFGLDAIEEAVAASQVRRLLKDGHGSTRQLVDALGNVISNDGTPQVFAYDAYGVPVGFTLANALTALLYSGEMTDQLTGLQYLRARYYNPATGTFNRLDPFAGNFSDPRSLHKYLYTHGDPVNG